MFKSFLDHHNLSEIRFRSDLFPTVEDRAFWESFPYAACIANAEQELDYTWPIIKATDFMEFKKSGNRVVMEDIHFDRRNHLVLFALAELMENKGRFLEQLVNGIFTTCEESFWGLSAHCLKKDFELPYVPTPAEPYIDLFAAETAEHLALIITLLRKPLERFCPEILDRVLYELNRRIMTPYETRLDFWWMGHGTKKPNNWNPWILSNVLTVFLLCETNERRKSRAIGKIMFESQHYYDELPEDGGCDEGPHYWGRAGASLFEVTYQLKAASDGAIDFFDDGKLGRIAAYMKKVHIYDDRFVNVGDAHASGIPSAFALLFGFGKETHQDDLMNLSAAAYRSCGQPPLVHHTWRTMRTLIYVVDWLKQMESYPTTEPLHGKVEYLPDLQTAALRNGEKFLFAKGGHNQAHHNHNDVGSFVYFDGSTPVLVDVGINTYTRWTFDHKTRYTVIPWTQARNHNLPMINGVDQKRGRDFCADGFSVDEEKIEISFAGAYPSEASIERLTRSLSFCENGMTVTDRFVFGEASGAAVSEVLMSTLSARIEDGAVILGERYRVSADCGVPSIEYIPFEDAHLERDWQCEGVNRITFDAESVSELRITVEKR